MGKCLISSHLFYFLDMLCVACFGHIKNFCTKKRQKWSVCSFFVVLLVGFPCLFKCTFAESKMLLEDDSRISMPGKLITENFPIGTETSIKLSYGRDESIFEIVCEFGKSLSGFMASINNASQECGEKSSNQRPHDDFCHKFSHPFFCIGFIRVNAVP